MFSPGGIAGWLALHQPLLRGGRIVKLIPAYALAAVPLAANLLGGILLIELAHHMLVEAPSGGSSFMMFRITMDGASLWPWLCAGVLFFGGALGLRAVWPSIGNAWALATADSAEKVTS